MGVRPENDAAVPRVRLELSVDQLAERTRIRPHVIESIEIDDFAPCLSFFWNAHNNFFEEVAKFRASRRIWYRLMNDRFGAKKESSKLLRFHTQTGGSTLTAQQPENNIVRVALQSMAAVMGGTQSLHTNGFDEALGLPTEQAAKLALRTQQVIGYESGIADTVDPLAGSYFVESLTDQIEALAWEYIAKIDEMGGMVAANLSGPRRIGPAGALRDQVLDEQGRVDALLNISGGARGTDTVAEARIPASIRRPTPAMWTASGPSRKTQRCPSMRIGETGP